MQFKKYSSIENHYRQKYIDKMLHINPEANDVIWIAREKLDGANIQIVISPTEPMKVGKRSCYLEQDEAFFDIWQTLARYNHELDVLSRASKLYNKTYRFFGEIYGPGINGRVDYGDAKRIAIFDCEVDGVLMTQKELEDFLYARDMMHFLPKYLAMGKLLDVLQVNVETGNTEGAVLKPYEHNFFNQDERFIIKKKSTKFLDEERNENEPKGPNQNDITYNLNQEFKKYISKNRVIDLFAKHGPMTEMNQMGTYINLILEDAKIDFLKDFPEVKDLDKKQQKELYKVGGLIVNILKELM